MSLGAQEEVPYLTPMRRAILDAIVASHDERGIAPSIGELCDAVGLTRATVHMHLRRLQEDGWVTALPGTPRSLVVRRSPGQPPRDEAVAALMHMWGIAEDDEEGYDAACLAVDLVAPILRRER